jgi:transposase
MTITPSWIGIDISKAWLDIADPALGRTDRVANRDPAITAFARTLEGRGATVLFEATGVYDACLRHALAAAGVACVRVNPQRARDFARATGRLAKTDVIDAAMLAEMGRALRLSPDPAPDRTREKLNLLNKRRDQLVAMRQQERLRRLEAADATICEGIDAHLGWLDQAIAEIEAAIRDLVSASADLARAEVLLRSTPGIGAVGAAVLIGLLPELGHRSARQIAMLAGLAPVNQDSGAKRGQRSIRGGRRRVRQALYMAAVVTLRTRSPFAAFYNRLRSAGKPAKVALIALARKILVTLNAIMRTQTPYTP